MRWVDRGRSSEARTDVNASASVVRGGLDYRDFLSVRGGATSSSRATAATPNEDDVVFIGKLDWGHFGRVERPRDLAGRVRSGGEDMGKEKEKPGRVFGEGTADAVGERGGGEPAFGCSSASGVFIGLQGVLTHRSVFDRGSHTSPTASTASSR